MSHEKNNNGGRSMILLRKRKKVNYEEPAVTNSFEETRVNDSSSESSGDEFSPISFDTLKQKMDIKLTAANSKKSKIIPVSFEDEDDSKMSEYEKLRMKNLEENRKMMLELGILTAKKEASPVSRKEPKKRAYKKKPVFESRQSLRLQGKTPTGNIFTPRINDTPIENIPVYKSRRVEDELPMAEDESCIDMLDNLRNCLPTSFNDENNSSLSVDSKRLLNDMYGLHVAALRTKVVHKRIQSICIHPLESKLLVIAGCTEGSLGFWDVGSDSGLAQYEPHVRAVNCISICNSDQSKLFSTSHDGTVRRADIRKGVFDLVYQTDESEKLSHITWHCELDKNTLLVAHGSGVVGVIDMRLGFEKSLTRSYNCHSKSVRTIQLHPLQSHYFLTSSGTGESKIFDIRQKKQNEGLINLTNNNGKGITSAFFSPNGNKVLTTCNDDRLRMYDVTDLQNPKESFKTVHDNHTGRWLSVFKAKWHPTSSDIFFIGSMQYPKRVQIYNGRAEIMREISDDDLTTICPVLDIHPTQSIVTGGDSVGRVYIFTTQTHVNRLNL